MVGVDQYMVCKCSRRFVLSIFQHVESTMDDCEMGPIAASAAANDWGRPRRREKEDEEALPLDDACVAVATATTTMQQQQQRKKQQQQHRQQEADSNCQGTFLEFLGEDFFFGEAGIFSLLHKKLLFYILSFFLFEIRTIVDAFSFLSLSLSSAARTRESCFGSPSLSPQRKWNRIIRKHFFTTVEPRFMIFFAMMLYLAIHFLKKLHPRFTINLDLVSFFMLAKIETLLYCPHNKTCGEGRGKHPLLNSFHPPNPPESVSFPRSPLPPSPPSPSPHAFFAR